MGGVNPRSPARLQPCLQRRVGVLKRGVFSPEHPCGLVQAWALWPAFAVFVFAAAALVHRARRGYGILFLFFFFSLAASPSGAQPASLGCALQRLQPQPCDQRGECRHPEQCLLRNSASSDRNLFFHSRVFLRFFSLLQFAQLGSFLKTFSR